MMREQGDDLARPQPVGGLWAVLGSVVGAIAGGACGFLIRARLNQEEVIGFGNIPEQIGKLVLWTLLGAAIAATLGTGITAVLGFLVGKAIERRKR